MANKKLQVQDLKIGVKSIDGLGDYISLTDIAKKKSHHSGIVISNWLTTKFTQDFLRIWEELHNPDFNVMEFHNIKVWIM